MEIYRYMSPAEAQALLQGKRISNFTDHRARRGTATTAQGFCFGIGGYEQAVKDYRRLSGIVSPERLLVGKTTPQFACRLNSCRGRYIDYDNFPEEEELSTPIGMEPQRFFRELCTHEYALSDFEEYEIRDTGKTSLPLFIKII